MRAEAVIFDFYGTLARNTETFDMAELVAAHGCSLPPDVRSAWWNGDQDGIEHLEHSRSAEHYRAWQRARLDGFLERVTGSRSTRSSIRAAIEAHRSERRLRAYPEVKATLRSFRELGLRVVVCSNWDWELDAALDEAGLTPLVDTMVSSAWAGARKPHPRIYEHTLRDAGTTAAAAVFVGDSWGPDVEGPRAAGIRAAYLAREDHWPDPTRPPELPAGIAVLDDLTGVLTLVADDVPSSPTA